MILLFGGTTEAKQVARCLEQAGLAYIYSTKTPVAFEGKGEYRFGPRNKEALEKYCAEKQISCIINASHPFARELHQTVAAISQPIPLLRFERQASGRQEHPLVFYVADYAEAVVLLEERGCERLLALSGVQSIPQLRPFWEHKKCWFRILDRDSSREFAAQHGFPVEDLLYGLPQDKEAEGRLFRELKADAVLTKESGINGKQEAKIAAAIVCNIPVFILQKPLLAAGYRVIHTEEDLIKALPH